MGIGKVWVWGLALGLATPVLAQTPKPVVVGVVDSEINTADPRLKDKVYINTKETSLLDDGDRNGFKGDIEGWNRATGDGQIYTPARAILRYYEAILDYRDFLQTNYTRELNKKELEDAKHVGQDIPSGVLKAFHNTAHGQHVAGVILKETNNTQIVPVVYINDEMAAQIKPNIGIAVSEAIINLKTYKVDPQFMTGDLEQKLYAQKEIRIPLYPVVTLYLNLFKPIFDFLKTRPIRVVNLSIAADLRGPLASIVSERWQETFFAAPKPEYLEAYVHAAQKYASMHMYSWMLEQKKTLFVMAASNASDPMDFNEELIANNNDLDPQFPSSVAKWFDAHNLIVVAATIDRKSFASFSNYGAQSVDVAAPGYKISSYYPEGGEFTASGTSMATPYVTNTAARMLEVNEKLSARNLKKIILATVDKKEFLKDKVKTSGIVNPDRAIKAASLSLKLSIDKAIEKSRLEIKDLEE